tara:strand:- start:1052 stop:1561 length:510 start_codon:yes stop_codon:yes gene_type:complete
MTHAAAASLPDGVELGGTRGNLVGRRFRELLQGHVTIEATRGGSSPRVQRFARKIRAKNISDTHPVIITGPGEEAQSNYGQGPMVRDPETGKYRRTRLFVLTLGNSRKSVRLLTFRSSSKIWAQLHEKAFRRLGGAPKLVVIDNLREGVDTRIHGTTKRQIATMFETLT